jgi:hypothetical protein
MLGVRQPSTSSGAPIYRSQIRRTGALAPGSWLAFPERTSGTIEKRRELVAQGEKGK